MDQNNKPPKIVFEGEEFQHSTRSFQSQTPKIVGWVIKYSGGHIKDEQQANYFLIGFVAVMVFVSLFLVFGGSSNTSQKPDAVFLEQVKNMQQAPVNK